MHPPIADCARYDSLRGTREPIRDETLREGLVATGAVTERTDLATTSSKPRYASKANFAALFDLRLMVRRCRSALRHGRPRH